jgi:hypothetical protein
MTSGSHVVVELDPPGPVSPRAGALRRRAERSVSGWPGALVPVVVALFYLGLVLLLWLPRGWGDGMPYETAFPWTSENAGFWSSFFYLADPLRIYTSVFYNLGYHLSLWLGLGGSFLGFQLVYAFLWWARGLLAYLIVAALFPARRVFAVVVGIIVLVQASDHAINWVGQMNQYGMIFWILLAIYTLVLGLKARTWALALPLALLSAVFVRMGLWSYESPLFIALIVPFLLLALRFGFSRRSIVVAAIYLVNPVIYALDNLRRYTQSSGNLYQDSVVRKDASPLPILGDLWFNVKSSVEFWQWGVGLPPITAHHERTLLCLGGAVVAASLVVVVAALLRRRGDLLPSSRALIWLAGTGALLLLASFPAYVVLAGARQLWRTQFLSGIGTGLLLASLIGLLAHAVRRRVAQVGILAAASAVIAYYGVGAAFEAATFHYGVWSRSRTAIAEVLQVAPRVKPGTIVVLTNVPKTADPFGDTLWFDYEVRLAYPKEQVAGLYFYSGGEAGPGAGLHLDGTTWTYGNTGTYPLVQNVDFGKAVFVRYSPSGHGTLLRTVPSFLMRSRLQPLYHPTGRIAPGATPAFVKHRYGPISGS